MKKTFKRWTKKECLSEALKYSRKVDWRNNSINSHNAARINGWFKDCCLHMLSAEESYKIGNEKKKKWDLEKCKLDALKYDSRANWYYGSKGGYAAAFRNNWIEECSGHMLTTKESKSRGATKYLKKDCYKASKKYKTKKDWYDNDRGTYCTAKRYKILDECCKHMTHAFILISRANTKGSYEKSKKASILYKTKMEWVLNDEPTYDFAKRNGFLPELTSHMPEYASGKLREKHCYKKYIKLFNKYKTSYAFEFRMSKSSRIEFVIKTPEGFFGIEVKHDESRWSNSELQKQMKKYIKDGMNHNIKGFIISSPKGKYGYSINDLEKAIKLNKLHKLIFKPEL